MYVRTYICKRMMVMVMGSSIHVIGYCIAQENHLSAFICILYVCIHLCVIQRSAAGMYRNEMMLA